MTQYVSTHALERGVRQLAVGNVLALDSRRAAAGYDQLGEITHQFQVPVGGIARSGAAWTKVQLTFDVDFVFAPEQRDSVLAVPHFTYGAVVSGETPVGVAPDTNNPDNLVAVVAHVIEWARDRATDAITGAVVGIGASTLGGGEVSFAGFVHLTFQGYGAVSEPEPGNITADSNP